MLILKKQDEHYLVSMNVFSINDFIIKFNIFFNILTSISIPLSKDYLTFHFKLLLNQLIYIHLIDFI